MSLLPTLDSLQGPTTLPTWSGNDVNASAFADIRSNGLAPAPRAPVPGMIPTEPEYKGVRGSWKQHHLLGSLRGPGITERINPSAQQFMLQPYQLASTKGGSSLQEDWSDLPVSNFS